MLILLWMVLGLIAAPAFAGDELQMLAFSMLRESSQTSDWLLVLLAGLLGIALWSSVARWTPALSTRRHGPNAQNLFISVRMQVVGAQTQPPRDGFLRSLNLRQASLVSAEPMVKGERIQIELQSLPGQKGPPQTINAQVISLRTFCTASRTYLVNLRLDPHVDESAPLSLYLVELTRRSVSSSV